MEPFVKCLSTIGPIKIDAFQVAVTAYLRALGFNRTEQAAIANNILEAELCGKTTHGLLRLELLYTLVMQRTITPDSPQPTFQRKTANYLLVNGMGGTGYSVLASSLKNAMLSFKKSPIQIVGLTNTAPSTGYFGAFARQAASNGLGFLGFTNSAGGLVPHGSREALWGLNPTAIGLPFKKDPIVIDFSAGSTTWGNLLRHSKDGEAISDNTAIDANGAITRDAKAALTGGILPFGGQKGSAIAFFIEILAGIMTSSRAGKNVVGGWGTYFLLFDPYAFTSVRQYHQNLNVMIAELKSSKPVHIAQEIFYPGEQSGLLRKRNLANGTINVDLILFEQIIISTGQPKIFPKTTF